MENEIKNFNSKHFFTSNFVEEMVDSDYSFFELKNILDDLPRESKKMFLDSCLKKKKHLKLLLMIIAKRIIEDNKKNDLDIYKSFIEDNYQLLLKLTNMPYHIKKILELSNKDASLVNGYIDDNREKTLKSFLANIHGINDDAGYEFVKIIVEEVCKNENVALEDVELLGIGSGSCVYGVGNKVIKIYTNRFTYNISDNPYIIKPLIRKSIKDNDLNFFIEVTEKVDTKTDISNDEIYSLYKNIRNCGLIWTDPKKSNVGRLQRDNDIYWDDNIYYNTKSLGLLDNSYNYKGLKKGDVVLTDADLIFREEIDEPISLYTSLYVKCEKKFQKELNILLDTIDNLDYNSYEFNKIAIEYGFNPEYLRWKLDRTKKLESLLNMNDTISDEYIDLINKDNFSYKYIKDKRNRLEWLINHIKTNLIKKKIDKSFKYTQNSFNNDSAKYGFRPSFIRKYYNSLNKTKRNR